MHLKPFQRQDLARAALHDGLILSWDTGLGKTWAMFLWPLLKVGHLSHQSPESHAPPELRPAKPVLLVAPDGLHAQIRAEAWEHFRIRPVTLDSQATFERLLERGLQPASTPSPESGSSPIGVNAALRLPPAFYLTSYTQLTGNGVKALPRVSDYADPRQLLDELGLKIGEKETTQPRMHTKKLEHA